MYFHLLCIKNGKEFTILISQCMVVFGLVFSILLEFSTINRQKIIYTYIIFGN